MYIYIYISYLYYIYIYHLYIYMYIYIYIYHGKIYKQFGNLFLAKKVMDTVIGILYIFIILDLNWI